MIGKVLVTGGLGFIGLHLAKRLSESGYSVTLVDNLSRGIIDLETKKLLSESTVNFVEIDLLNKAEVFELGREFNYIFHLAAIIGVVHVLKRPYDVLAQNTAMLGAVLELGQRQTALRRFLFASTSEVYAGTLKEFGLIIPTPEKTALTVSGLDKPRTTYMLSKIMGEALCHHAQIPITIFRPHNIYGPRMGMAHVIPEQLKKAWLAKEDTLIPVYSPAHSRSFCYIDDAVEILQRMMLCVQAEGETLNLGASGPEITMSEIAKLCHKVAGKRVGIELMAETPGSPERRAPDMTKTASLLDLDPKVGLAEGITRTWEWYLSYVFENGGRSAC
jgi:UDP-glucose 4-epimerase